MDNEGFLVLSWTLEGNRKNWPSLISKVARAYLWWGVKSGDVDITEDLNLTNKYETGSSGLMEFAWMLRSCLFPWSRLKCLLGRWRRNLEREGAWLTKGEKWSYNYVTNLYNPQLLILSDSADLILLNDLDDSCDNPLTNSEMLENLHIRLIGCLFCSQDDLGYISDTLIMFSMLGITSI